MGAGATLFSWFRQLCSVLYVAYLLKQFQWPDQPMMVLPVHAFATAALAIMWRPLFLFGRRKPGAVLDAVMVAICAYLIWHYITGAARMQTRIEGVDPVMFGEYVAFCAGIPIILEAVRRSGGMSLLAVVVAFLVYGFFGSYFPGWFRFSGFSLTDFTEITMLGTEGLFGVCTSSMVSFVFYFVLFGAVFMASGGGGIFIDLALGLSGRLVGGSAKAAIVASALFGTVSGSAVANVTSTGVLTIPLMMGSGYSREQAGATEAVASTGGQLMPPVMGVAAFVMADLLGVPYTTIALAGIIPAVGYYVALFINVDLLARKTGIGIVDYKELKGKMAPILPRLHLLAGPIVLVAFLFSGASVSMSALMGTLVSLIAPFLRRSTRLDLRAIWNMAIDTGKQMAAVSVPVTAVGVIITVAIQSGIAIKFVSLLAQLGHDRLLLSLFLVIFGCLVLGLGLPTVAAYIISAVMFVPALTKLGISPLAAHFFVMYYSVMCMITPPVALAAFAAAAIAKADATRTGLVAFRLALVVFILPFGFINDPALLWQGTLQHILIAAAGIVIATASWAVALQGWLGRPLGWVLRAAFTASCVIIVYYPTFSLFWNIGIAAVFVMATWCIATRNKTRRPSLA